MELKKRTPLLIQLSMITVMSVAGSYVFIYTKTAILLNGLCFYRYAVYFAAIFLGYWCLSHYKKYIGFAFSSALTLIAFSPVGKEAVELFPLVVPFLAALLGVISILVVPRSWGKGFFEFIAVLVLPALLAESRIGGSTRLIATVSSIGYYELSLATIVVVGGYFYLRYAALANLNKTELLSNGGSQKDVTEADRLGNIITARTLLGACGTAGILMVAVPTVSDALRSTRLSSPLSVLALELTAGIATAIILYLLRFHRKERFEQSQKR